MILHGIQCDLICILIFDFQRLLGGPRSALHASLRWTDQLSEGFHSAQDNLGEDIHNDGRSASRSATLEHDTDVNNEHSDPCKNAERTATEKSSKSTEQRSSRMAANGWHPYVPMTVSRILYMDFDTIS